MKGWFGRKKYGWGFGPRTWQGYALVISFIIGLFIYNYLTKK